MEIMVTIEFSISTTDKKIKLHLIKKENVSAGRAVCVVMSHWWQWHGHGDINVLNQCAHV